MYFNFFFKSCDQIINDGITLKHTYLLKNMIDRNKRQVLYSSDCSKCDRASVDSENAKGHLR